jgi:hypothetical protein
VSKSLSDIEWREKLPAAAAEWLVVTHHGTCGSVHHVPEEEAKRIADVAHAQGLTIVEGPRAATDLEVLTPFERDAALRNGVRS